MWAKTGKEEEEGLLWSYLRAPGAFPIHDVVLEMRQFFLHGVVGGGQGVQDVDVYAAPSGGENHAARGAQVRWREEEKLV